MTPALFSMPSGSEFLLILIILLLLFGAQKLPALARALGRSLGEFKKGRDEGNREDPKPPDPPPEAGAKPS